MALAAQFDTNQGVGQFHFVQGEHTDSPVVGQWENTQRFVAQGTMGLADPHVPAESCQEEGCAQYLHPGDQLELSNNIQDVNGQRYVQATIKNNGFSDGKLSDGQVWVPLDKTTTDRSQVQPDQNDPSGGSSAGDGSRQSFVEAFRKLTGVKYLWGGESQSGCDCSGCVRLAAKNAGVAGSLPRSSKDMAAFTGANLTPDQAKAGDLCFKGSPVHHVVACTEDGCKKIIQNAQSGSTVAEGELDGPRRVQVRRLHRQGRRRRQGRLSLRAWAVPASRRRPAPRCIGHRRPAPRP